MDPDPRSDVVPRRIAIGGIDGSGKSTAIARCRERLPTCRLVRFPGYHAEPGLTLEPLSRDVVELTKIAEELASAELKFTGLYLLGTMFGPIEREVAQSIPAPRIVLQERHAIVDFNAYMTSYLSMMRRMTPLRDVADEARRRLAARRPGGAERIASWIDAQAARVGGPARLEDHPAHVYELETLTVDARIDRLEHEFLVEIPDVLIVLDIPPDLAYARMLARGEPLDMHEQRGVLDEIQRGYRQAVADLAVHRPRCAIHVVDVADGDIPEKIAARIMTALGQE